MQLFANQKQVKFLSVGHIEQMQQESSDPQLVHRPKTSQCNNLQMKKIYIFFHLSPYRTRTEVVMWCMTSQYKSKASNGVRTNQLVN